MKQKVIKISEGKVDLIPDSWLTRQITVTLRDAV